MLLKKEYEDVFDKYCFILHIEEEVWIAVLEGNTYYPLEPLEFLRDPNGICPGDEELRATWLALPDRRGLFTKDGE